MDVLGDAVWAALDAGATLLASHAGLVQALAAEYDRRQLEAGRRSWPRAAVATLEAWLGRAWAQSGDRLLLSLAQELRLWEEIVTAAAAESPLLDAAATAATAAEAWQLAHAYRLDWAHANWDPSEDTAAFGGWALRFSGHLHRQGWITAAELPAAVAAELGRGDVKPPARVALAGFDELNPAQQALVAALRGAGAQVEVLAPTRELAAAQLVRALDAERELELAAAWARDLLDRGAPGPIGVVVADLQAQRTAAERIFLAALHPGREPGSTVPRAFHFSLGLPLTAYPLVGAALDSLEVMDALAAPAPVDLAAILPWLRSPFIAAAETEAEARAGLEQALRDKRRRRWTWNDLRPHLSAHCPQLAKVLSVVLQEIRRWPPRLEHRHWAAGFARLWEATGWPGERPLSSAEFQTRQAWERLQDEFSRLDQIEPRPIGATEARRRLRQLAAARIFQPQAAAAPVQIMGWLEAAGMEFSHLRVLGLHDGALPAAAAPNPFLPLDWQHAQGLPRASAAQEAAFAARVWDRLRRSTEVMAASFPVRAGDEELRPSPLLAGLDVSPPPAPPVAPPAVELEETQDLGGPPLAQATVSGGSQIFTEQSACPFRAFVHLRLKAESPEPLPEGLAATTRGSLLHDLLRVVWSQLQSQERLLATPKAELQELVERSAATIIDEEAALHGLPGLAALEHERLVQTLLAWLKEEIQRRPFTAEMLEAKTPIAFAGLELDLKVDRVDALADGSLALLDYKSGETAVRDWGHAAQPRMRAPQLPLYLVSHPQRDRIAALAFAQVRRGDMRFRGKEREAGTLLGAKLDHSHHPLPWPDQLDRWQHELGRVAEEFRRGLAPVDPLDTQTCTYCDLHAVCRIREVRAAAGTAEDGEDSDAD